MNETIIVGNATINLTNIFIPYNPNGINMQVANIIKNVCTQWTGYTYDSHFTYFRLIIFAFIFAKLNKLFYIPIPKLKFKDVIKNKFVNKYIGNWYISEKETGLFYEIQDLLIRVLLFYILYTFFNQLIYVEQLPFIEIIKKILGV